MFGLDCSVELVVEIIFKKIACEKKHVLIYYIIFEAEKV